MSVVVVNDASCLIDLRKGNLLAELSTLPFCFVLPYPVRRSELLCFTNADWDILEKVGVKSHDLTAEQVEAALLLKSEFGSLSANDCFCIVTAQFYENSILLTGDAQLRKVATHKGICVHGVLWITDQLVLANAPSLKVVLKALATWKSDPAVFLPDPLIDQRLGCYPQIPG